MSASEARCTPMLQPTVKDQSLPAEIRLGFIKKVYGILFVMLLTSSGIAAPFVFQRQETLKFMDKNPWIPMLAMAFLVVHQLVNVVMMLGACCGASGCMRAYLKMFVVVPFNYLFVMSYAAAIGVLLGFVCASYQAESVALVFALTAGIMASLTIYAVFTKSDFTGCGPYVFVMLVSLLLTSLVAAFFPYDSLVHKAVAGLGALIMSIVIVYDTQLIFGSASPGMSRSSGIGRIEFTVDMYCFAAYNLYLDFINLFLYLLQLFGRRN